MLFCTLALYLGWRWAESGSWWFAGFAGVAVGLATASKLTGILFLPAILLVGLLKIGLSRRLVFQGVLISLAAVATVLATYAPAWSEAPSAIQYMFDFQSRHNARGHGVTINGVVYQFPPWWTHLWWQWEFYGPLANLSLGAALVVALLRRRSLDLYLLAAALVPFLFLSFYAQVKIAKYFSAWQPVLILVLVLAAGKLARQGVSRRIFAALLLAPFIYLGAQAIQAVSQVQPGQYGAAAEYLKDTSHDKGPTLVWGQDAVVQAYLPKARVINFSWFSERWPRDAPEEEIEVVIVDVEFSRRQPSPQIEEYLAKNRDALPLAYTTNEKNIEVYARKPEG
jgi:hypothetical protein